MKAKVYDQHAASFPLVSAFVVTDKSGERVATIAFKFPKDGAGRCYAYIHLIGVPMVRGQATGYGYDKKSAACENAMEKFAKEKVYGETGLSAEGLAFVTALRDIGGSNWDKVLRDAGFNVLQAV